MYSRLSTLALALYSVGVTLVCIVAYTAFQFYRSPTIRDPLLVETSGQGNSTSYRKGNYDATLAQRAARLVNVQLRVEQLQRTVERTSKTLQERTVLLNQKRAECRQLQNELDETLALVYEFWAEQTPAPKNADDSKRQDQAANARAELESELDLLRSELAKTALLEEEQTTQVENLTDELMQTGSAISEIQSLAGLEIGDITDEKIAVESAAADALVMAGEAAVRPLLDLTDDTHPAVRRWAAQVLGRLGRNAREAIPILKNLLDDPVERVRLQAKEALSAIEAAGEK